MFAFLFALAISVPPTGRLVLPAGVVELARELRIPSGAHDLVITGHRSGTTLRLAPGFSGRAAIVCERAANIRFAGFTVDGLRDRFPQRIGLPPGNLTFAVFYKRNGILASQVEGLSMDRVTFKNMWGFAVLVSDSQRVRLERLVVKDSGSRDERGRNNTTGGILFEQGVTDFEVRQSRFENVLGNGIWTHSMYGSLRNARGLIAENQLREIGRDAIQAGHATEIRIEANTGRRIGYPFDVVDIERSAIPVGIDTAGDVDHSLYTLNRFEEVNGKCIDLDGFHDGVVSFNTCINRGAADDYPYGQFGIALNNANRDMQSERVTIADNTIDGVKFAGIFLIGSNHTVVRNKLLRLNLGHCNENAAKYYGCVSIPGEPNVLQAGIYIGNQGERPAPAHGNVIRDNLITGYKMDTRCILAGSGVKLKDNVIEGNVCRGE